MIRTAAWPSTAAIAVARRARSIASTAPALATESEAEGSRSALQESPPGRPPFTKQTAPSSALISDPIAKVKLVQSAAQDAKAQQQSVAAKVKNLLAWEWIAANSDRYKSLQESRKGEGADPVYIHKEHSLAISYRKARAWLWQPSEQLRDQDGQVFTTPGVSSVSEEEQDRLLMETWKKLSDSQRAESLLRAEFQCMRRLGWRKGYSSGYPLKVAKGANAKVLIENRFGSLSKLASPAATERKEALKELSSAEERLAWGAWIKMSKEERMEEAKMAWANRDRSLIYIDDTASVMGTPMPRWYNKPQQIGAMTFLPNTFIRLVRNNTPRDGQYDAFKATFRVPLSMHKHSLKSYLLAIYGLRTTWIRSAIFRAPIKRSRLGQKKVGNSNRTFKKIEVGLLEPFVFPEISRQFIQDKMMGPEFAMEKSKTLFNLSGKRRWRTKAALRQPPTDSSGASIEHDAVIVREVDTEEDGESGLTSSNIINVDRATKRVSLFRKSGVETQKRSTILKLVHKQRLAKEAEVAARVTAMEQAVEDRRLKEVQRQEEEEKRRRSAN